MGCGGDGERLQASRPDIKTRRLKMRAWTRLVVLETKTKWVDRRYFKLFLKMSFIYFQREEGKEKGRETSMCGCFSCVPHWGPGPQPRHVPWLGIQLAILWFTGRCSIRWATPARAGDTFFRNNLQDLLGGSGRRKDTLTLGFWLSQLVGGWYHLVCYWGEVTGEKVRLKNLF